MVKTNLVLAEARMLMMWMMQLKATAEECDHDNVAVEQERCKMVVVIHHCLYYQCVMSRWTWVAMLVLVVLVMLNMPFQALGTTLGLEHILRTCTCQDRLDISTWNALHP